MPVVSWEIAGIWFETRGAGHCRGGGALGGVERLRRGQPEDLRSQLPAVRAVTARRPRSGAASASLAGAHSTAHRLSRAIGRGAAGAARGATPAASGHRAGRGLRLRGGPGHLVRRQKDEGFCRWGCERRRGHRLISWIGNGADRHQLGNPGRRPCRGDRRRSDLGPRRASVLARSRDRLAGRRDLVPRPPARSGNHRAFGRRGRVVLGPIHRARSRRNSVWRRRQRTVRPRRPELVPD